MFAFDRWSDWLKSEADALRRDGLLCEYRDNRDISATAANPSFGLEVETAKSLGWLRFWKLGTCDYQLMDKATGELAADEVMLDANDETIAGLFARFKSLLEQAEQ